MGVMDYIAGEIRTELLKQPVEIACKTLQCKERAEELIATIDGLRPIIREVQYSGVEPSEIRRSQLSGLMKTFKEGTDLCQLVRTSNRWNLLRNFQLVRRMEKIERKIATFLRGPLPAHTLADVHHLLSNMKERLDVLEGAGRRIERRLSGMKIRSGGGVEEAMVMEWEGVCGEEEFGAALEVGKMKVREMMEVEREDLRVFGICGIGGSGKTTLARKLCEDDQVQSYFENRIIFLTVSQSPNIESLKASIWGNLMGFYGFSTYDQVPNLNIKEKRTLVVLDDVWSQSVLEQLIFPVPGCKTLVVSRFKFTEVIKYSYEIELLKEHEAMSLFCYSAFGEKSIPSAVREDLVKEIVSECKGLPLALKVIGASLRDQPEMFWIAARKRLSRGEMICESRCSKFMERMAASVGYLEGRVRECFLDLGAFPEDTRIPLDVLINMWAETHSLDEEEVFAVVLELSNKNLINLVEHSRAGEMYSTNFEVSVSQHDVLRDLAIHLNKQENVIERKRLLMPRRESKLPEDWGSNSDRPFNAQIVSVHTGEMNEMDWPAMEFPKAEVLILNFSSSSYFLPPFIGNMPRLRALIVINRSTSNAILRNFSVFSNLTNLRSLWLEKVCVPPFSETTVSLNKMKKISLVLCKVDESLGPSNFDLPHIFPGLLELRIDCCNDLLELPPSICRVHTLKTLSIMNCPSLLRLPADLRKLRSLEILRIYACPDLRMLPQEIGELNRLKYLDISQCIRLAHLPEGMRKLEKLEKIDMRDCVQISCIPKWVESMPSLRSVICDEEVSWVWKDAAKVTPGLHVQVAEKCFNLNWLDE